MAAVNHRGKIRGNFLAVKYHPNSPIVSALNFSITHCYERPIDGMGGGYDP